MSSALEPRLTPLDKRVLDALPARSPGVRFATIAQQTRKHGGAALLGVDTLDVLLVLRGLEHLGKAHQRNGWWTR